SRQYRRTNPPDATTPIVQPHKRPDQRSQTLTYDESFTDLQAAAPGHTESVSMIHKAIKEF
ncbi:hypothetical protein ACFXEL_36755, partial [Streptomyces sp. NPDC059382]